VKLAVAAPVGVPLITPAADRVKPAGSAPPAMDHVYPDVPPEAARVCEYATPIEPPGKGEAVVMESVVGLIVIERAFVVDCDPASLTRTVKLTVPAAVGVPLITPPDKANPAGNGPVASVHVYGNVPPLAVNVCE
jgi:hypothetical protein